MVFGKVVPPPPPFFLPPFFLCATTPLASLFSRGKLALIEWAVPHDFEALWPILEKREKIFAGLLEAVI